MTSIGILIAMWEELTPLRKHWGLDWTGPGDFFTGRAEGVRVQVALSGVGTRRARSACDQLLRYGQPKLLLSLGYSGGLRADLKPGDCVLAGEIATETSRFVSPRRLPDREQFWRTGSLLCVENLQPQAEHKREWARRFPEALALDMESAVVAETAAQAGLPWLALRVIIDDLDTDLPLDFSRCLNQKGQMDAGKLARQVALHPQRIPGLLRFSKGAGQARRRLVECAGRVLQEVASL